METKTEIATLCEEIGWSPNRLAERSHVMLGTARSWLKDADRPPPEQIMSVLRVLAQAHRENPIPPPPPRN